MSSRVPGVTTRNTFQPHPAPLQEAILLDSLIGIMGTGGRKTATGRCNPRYRILINAYKDKRDLFHVTTITINPGARPAAGAGTRRYSRPQTTPPATSPEQQRHSHILAASAEAAFVLLPEPAAWLYYAPPLCPPGGLPRWQSGLFPGCWLR